MRTIEEMLGQSPVVPVVTLANPGCSVPLANALCEGGITVIEITLRTDQALAAIAAVAEGRPEMIVGAGTCLTPEDLGAARDAGAEFAVIPGATPALLEAARDIGIALLPAGTTVSEVMILREQGHRLVKFFPAEASGGTTFLQAIGPVLPDVSFCPTGGVTAQNAPNYLALSNVTCVGGSWIAPTELIEAAAWAEISSRAADAAWLRRR
jgi:2-dehydro-3-deoxyphosphogluconate aldolase/(4S)-4-hydroxy-2-oxoglutarate aldolase